jgi:tRNA dimethylallyltransferase
VPHHLIDVAEVTDSFDAARFVTLARAAETAIRSRGRLPVYCGGTGLYFQALLGGLGDAPPADPALRAELERTPLERLLTELAARDPATHACIDRQNPRRVIRALEVIRLTDRPFSAQRADWAAITSGEAANRFFILQRTRADLDARINARVDAMFAAGLVQETRTMLERGLGSNPTALQAIGYRQVMEHLRGERPLAETIELVKTRTRQFAKRQMTWFRRYAPSDAHWLPLAPGQSATELADQLVGELA